MRVLRFLATADLQAHEWSQFSYVKKNGVNSRLYNCARVLDVVRKECRRRDISKFFFLGDLFEETDFIRVETYDIIYGRLEELHSAGIDTGILLGNHDITLSSASRVLHSLRPFRKVAQIIEKPLTLWSFIHCVPYLSSPREIKEGIRAAVRRSDSDNRVQPRILALHCGIQGARSGPEKVLIRNPIKLSDIKPDRFDLVIAGDYHSTQWLSDNVLYLGSPLQHTYGETHRPRIWDISLYDKPPWFKLEKIYTNFPMFRKVHAKDIADLREKTKRFTGDYVKCIMAPSDKLTEHDIEKVAKENDFSFRIERKRNEENVDQLGGVALDAKSYISRYTEQHSSGKKVERLVALGTRLYKGD